MTDRTPAEQLSDKDRLVTRPPDPLPTPLDPQVHSKPPDPKPKPETGQGEDPHAGDIDYTV